MAAPYSDDLYSADVSDGEQDALSPVDGYFHASSPSQSQSNREPASPAQPPPTSSNVPSVPNVLVEDPTLRDQGAAKAREAEEERLNNTDEPLPHASQSQSESQSRTAQPVSEPRPRSSHAPSPSSPHPQSQPQYQPPSSTPNPHPTSPSHHYRRSVEDDEPIRFPGHTRLATSVPFARALDAPPAYSPSSPQSGHTGSGYQTFAPQPQPQPASSAAMGVPEEQQRLLPRQPESMGGPPDRDGQDPPSAWQRVQDLFNVPNLRKKLKTILGVLVILSIVFVLFSSFTLRPSHKEPDIIDKDPVKKPSKDPKMDRGDLEWHPRGNCLDETYKWAKTANSVNFRRDHNVSVIQTIEKDHGPHTGWDPRVFGELILRPDSGSAPGKIELEVITNDKDLTVDVEFDDETQVFKAVTPRYIDWPHTSGSPCIQMRITVLIPDGSVLDYFTARSAQLDLYLEEGLVMGTTEGSKFSTLSGDITVPSLEDEDKGVVPYTLSSRDIVVSTVSGDVTGWYPLYDLLRIETVSGDITADVAPKRVDESKPKSAVLDVSSASGDIKVVEPLGKAIESPKPDKAFPPRDYVVKLGTASSKIDAAVAVSSSADVGSRSGDLDLQLWPVLDSSLLKSAAAKPNIKTSTTSGETKVEILEPLWTTVVGAGDAPGAPPTRKAPEWDDSDDIAPIGDDDPYVIIHPDDSAIQASELDEMEASADELRTRSTPALSILKSKHNSISGNIDLVYPSAWEGSLYAQTISGSQKIRGEGLEVERSGSYMRFVKGHKGSGYSELSVDTVSGDHDVLIGKEP